VTTLDLRQLECFIVVAEERHIGRAAARLHMTQPPLTRRMNRLERDVGVRLLTRTPTGVELTEPGRVLLERAQRLVRLSEHAIERTRLAGDGRVGQLVVGYFGSTILDTVPRLLHGFLQQHPSVGLMLERAAKNVQAEAVLDGRMHVGFSRGFREEPGLLVRTVLSEPLYLAAPRAHPLLQRAELHVADLRAQPLVLFPSAPRPSFADEISEMCRTAGFVVDAAREAEDAVTALAYVAAAGLCAVVPRSATVMGLPDVGYAPLADAPQQALSCLYRAGDPSPVLRRFLSHLDRWAHDPDDEPPAREST